MTTMPFAGREPDELSVPELIERCRWFFTDAPEAEDPLRDEPPNFVWLDESHGTALIDELERMGRELNEIKAEHERMVGWLDQQSTLDRALGDLWPSYCARLRGVDGK